jgi:hypothetical protein
MYIRGVLVNELRLIGTILSRPHLIIEIKLQTAINKHSFHGKLQNDTRHSI